jgi:hypothetical protein
MALLTATVLFTSCTKEDAPDLNPPQANAGDPQIVQLPKDSVTLTGTGKSSNGTIKGYLWSLISGPNRPLIATEGAAQTKVYGLVRGTYLFQFMVTDSVGLTGVDTVSVKVTSAPVDTLTLQPANNPNEGFIYTHLNEQGMVYNVPEFSATAWTIDGSYVAIRGMFRFDMGSIPAGARIVSAKLSIYSNPEPKNGDLQNANAGPDNSMYLSRITSSWNPSTVNWTNQPATETNGRVAVPHTTSSMLDLLDLDVTTMVSRMQTEGNFGFMIKLQNEAIYNSRIFCSSKFAVAAKHPKLVIVYEGQ